MSNQSKVTAEFPEKLQFLFQPKRYKVAHGGRGGSKSWNFARALLIMGAERPLRILCCREIQKSIKDSVHKLLKDQIAHLGFEEFYEVLENTIRGKNGTEIIFVGLKHNYANIKSYESVDIAWVGQAHLVSKSSWETLIPTIRKDGSEIWVSFNPDLAEDETYRRFVLDPPEDSIVVKVGWRDNPWFPPVLMKEMQELKRKDPDSWLNVWEGNPREITEGAIFANELRAAKAEERITRIPYDPVKPVDVYFDLGFADFTSIWFVQPIGMEIRIIDFYQNHLQAIQHYLKTMQDRQYVYRTVYLPHDADHETLAAGGRSIAKQVKAAGYSVRVIGRIPTKQMAIAAARAVFPMCYFDEARCADGLQALRHYRYEYDNDTGKWADKPMHDWASHAADAFMQIGVAIQSPKAKEDKGAAFANFRHRMQPRDSGEYREVYAS